MNKFVQLDVDRESKIYPLTKEAFYEFFTGKKWKELSETGNIFIEHDVYTGADLPTTRLFKIDQVDVLASGSMIAYAKYSEEDKKIVLADINDSFDTEHLDRLHELCDGRYITNEGPIFIFKGYKDSPRYEMIISSEDDIKAAGIIASTDTGKITSLHLVGGAYFAQSSDKKED